MKTFLKTGWLFIAILFIISCKSKSVSEAKYIPKDAVFVMTINSKSLQEKAKETKGILDSLQKIFSKEIAASNMTESLKKLTDLINQEEKLFFFSTMKKSMGSSPSFVMNVLGSIKDAKKFEEALKEQDKLKGTAVKKEGDFSYILMDDNGMVSWTDKYAMLSIYQKNDYGTYDRETGKYVPPAASNKSEELKKEIIRYFKLSESESMAGVTQFSDMFKQKADFYGFYSSNGYVGALEAMPIQLPKLSELLKDNYTTVTASFDDGKINILSSSFPNKILGNIYKTYAGPTTKTELLDNFPGQNINGFLVASFNPQLFKGLVKELEVEPLANTGLSNMGFTLEDIYKCIKGDIAVAVSDFSLQEKEVIYEGIKLKQKYPSAKMVLNMPIGDKASLFKILDKATELTNKMLVKENNVYTFSLNAEKNNGFGVYLRIDDKNIIVASDSLTYTQYASKSSKSTIDNALLSQAKGKSIFGYFDIARMMQTIGVTIKSEEDKKSFELVNNVFKDVVFYSDNYDGTQINGTAIINMKDEKQNSLVSITKMMSGLAIQMKERKKAMHDEMMSTDSMMHQD